MPATAAVPMNVEDFRRLPECETHIVELRGGEVVRVTRPKKRHSELVHRIQRLMLPVADQLGCWMVEFSYRPLAEFEVRVADLAFATWERWEAVDDDDYLLEAPDLVVEIASPSNNAEELQEKKKQWLANGCREFWVV
jgi:Uma2 family endonuclease